MHLVRATPISEKGLEMQNPPTVPNQIRVMAEVMSSGLWRPRALESGQTFARVRECEPDSMGISTALQDRLAAWCAQYDRAGGDVPEEPAEARAFSAEGLAIAVALQAELAHEEIWYFDEVLMCAGSPREAYLYRVTAA
jgi:hypothetical protein